MSRKNTTEQKPSNSKYADKKARQAEEPVNEFQHALDQNPPRRPQHGRRENTPRVDNRMDHAFPKLRTTPAWSLDLGGGWSAASVPTIAFGAEVDGKWETISRQEAITADMASAAERCGMHDLREQVYSRSSKAGGALGVAQIALQDPQHRAGESREENMMVIATPFGVLAYSFPLTEGTRKLVCPEYNREEFRKRRIVKPNFGIASRPLVDILTSAIMPNHQLRFNGFVKGEVSTEFVQVIGKHLYTRVFAVLEADGKLHNEQGQFDVDRCDKFATGVSTLMTALLYETSTTSTLVSLNPLEDEPLEEGRTATTGTTKPEEVLEWLRGVPPHQKGATRDLMDALENVLTRRENVKHRAEIEAAAKAAVEKALADLRAKGLLLDTPLPAQPVQPHVAPEPVVETIAQEPAVAVEPQVIAPEPVVAEAPQVIVEEAPLVKPELTAEQRDFSTAKIMLLTESLVKPLLMQLIVAAHGPAARKRTPEKQAALDIEEYDALFSDKAEECIAAAYDVHYEAAVEESVEEMVKCVEERAADLIIEWIEAEAAGAEAAIATEAGTEPVTEEAAA